jgi:hypothetical protein
VRIVYTAESVALAVLQVLVHLDSSDVLTAYPLCSAEFDDSLVERLERSVSRRTGATTRSRQGFNVYRRRMDGKRLFCSL